jgi:DNA-binding Xre family transcriptional regulator
MKILIREMAEAIRYGQMALSMKAIGKMTKLTEEAGLYMQMVMSMKENGKTIKLMGLEHICIQMVHNMKDIGKKINSTVKVKKLGLMVPVTKEIT